MSESTQYREHAAEMREKAQAAQSMGIRAEYLKLALQWDYLADAAEKRQR